MSCPGSSVKSASQVVPSLDEDDIRIERVASRVEEFVRRNSAFGEQLAVGTGIVGSKSSGANKISPESVNPFSDDFNLMSWVKDKRAHGESHGLQSTPVSLTWKNLEVYGDRIGRPEIATIGTPFKKMFSPAAETDDARCLIHDFSGFVAPGEMTLVLGAAGSGCSTLLRTLAGVSSGLSKQDGEVWINGIAQKEFMAKFPSYVTYNPEDDLHYPTLSVRETLRFALECKVGAAPQRDGETPEQARRRYIEDHLQVYLRIFGLLGCANTKVGNEFVRGCSGGEKKRVSIAEQLCVGASVGFWDGSTRGLDSSTALDFVRALRVLTDLSAQSQVISLYQASEDIYELFDNVAVVSQSRVIYFGPASQAKKYFADIGFFCPNRKTSPDFVTGITDLMEREILPGWESKVPNTIEEYEAAYKASNMFKAMEERRMEIEHSLTSSGASQKFIDTNKHNKVTMGLSSAVINSEYTTSFGQQIKALSKRELILASKDVGTIGAICFNVVMAVVIGLLFRDTQFTPDGIFLKGGVVFFSIMFLAMTAMPSISIIVSGRAINGKHKAYHLYRTHLQTVCTQIVSIPICIVSVLLWSVAMYFLCNLKATAGAFFYFCFALFVANHAFGALIRLVAQCCSSMDTSMTAAGLVLMFTVLFSGYFTPFPFMPEWCTFIFWMNPLHWATRSIMESEFEGAIIPCEGFQVPPPEYAMTFNSVTSANALMHSACAVTGAVPGDSFVRGEDYLRIYYGFANFDKWVSIGVQVGFMVLFYVLMIITAKYLGVVAPSYSVNVWKKKRAAYNAATADNNTMIKDGVKVTISRDEAADNAAKMFESNSASFSWKHVNYTVTMADGSKRQLLKDAQGFVKSGELVALMGSSGAGKTTLMDCITQRKTTGDLDFQVYVGGEPQNKEFRATTSYCEQIDVHNPYSTIRESVRFSARLRQPDSVPLFEKFAFADQVISLLELDNIAEAMVGAPNSASSISVEERKRLSIACELASKPRILFLDEPTSGLDSQAAFTIIRLLRKLADRGQAILCTVHQPSAVIFEKFDSILLLARGGVTTYFGPLGEDCKTLTGYFEGHGCPPCPPATNPAEYMLECIGAGVAGADVTKTAGNDWVKLWAESDAAKNLASEIDVIRGLDDAKVATHVGTSYGAPTFKTPFSTRFPAVWARMMRSYIRNPDYVMGRLIMMLLGGLVVGTSILSQPDTSLGLQMKLFGLLGTVFINNQFIFVIQPNFDNFRAIFMRERESAVYDWISFSISVISGEWPWIILSSALYIFPFYYLIDYNDDGDRLVYFWLLATAFQTFAGATGQAIIAMVPSISDSQAINPMVMSFFMMLCGATIPYPSMEAFWQGLYWANPVRYFLEGAMANELGGKKLECDTTFGSKFHPPTGLTCGEYMAPLFASGDLLGVLRNEDATDDCYYCNFATGDLMLEHQLAWSWDNRWMNFGILCAFCASSMLLTCLFIYLRKVKR